MRCIARDKPSTITDQAGKRESGELAAEFSHFAEEGGRPA